ncbi:MAG: hypothetical protein JWQ73_1719 [Variovorax sp.]|nr:hypothetical protein [Variovorax sp.]
MTSTQVRIEGNRVGAAALAEGTQPFEYEITGLIAEGDYGIVYLAFDPSSRERIAIREYLPTALAARSADSPDVIVKSPRHVDLYQSGLRSFINEARLLARFDHAAVVKVLRWWEGNGTAYMAMPYYEGPTLARSLAELGHAPDEAQLLDLLNPLLDGLAAMHAVRCLHRDIAPEKIILARNGPVLLDLGAARRVIGNIAQTPNSARQRGFAPIEQYGEAPSMKQGPWTDLYALAGVAYAAITGERPMAAVERLMDDRLVPISELARGRYSAPFLAAIDGALALRPQDRPQSAEAFRAQLNGHEVEPPSMAAGMSPDAAGTYATFPGPLEPLAPDAWQSTAASQIDLSRMNPLWSTDAALSGASDEPAPRRGRARYVVIAALVALLAFAIVAGAIFQARRADDAARSALGQKQALKLRQMREASTRPRAAIASLPLAAASVAPVASVEPLAPDAPIAPTSPEASALPEPIVISAKPAIAPIARISRAPPDEPPRTASMASSMARSTATATSPAAARPIPPSRGKCSEILQSASLGPLRPGDASLLQSECRP